MSSTTAMGAASKARPPAGGKTSGISAMIKATERAGACSWLSVRSRRPVEGVAMVDVATAIVGVVVIDGVSIDRGAIDDRSAMGDVVIVVVHRPMATPVVPPVTPAPAKSSEETDSKSNTEGDCGAAKKDSWHRNPARVGNDRRPVHEPGIIGRYVDHLRVGRLNDDRVALSRYLLLFVVLQL